MSTEPRVAVAVRIRPVIPGGSAMHQLEQYEHIAASRTGDNGVSLQEHKLDEACRSSAFQFDFVFDSDSTQLEVYEDSVVDLIDGALQTGSNATILAYGQTGSGKTHSMLGDVRPNPLNDQLLTPQSGIFLRVLSDLLAYRDRRAEKTHVVVGLSCVEVYNEKIRDLFGGASADDPPPQVKAMMVDEHVLLPGLIVKEVMTLNSVFNELQLAITRRQSRATGANKESSRSHCLFTVDVLQRDASAEAPTIETLHKLTDKIGKRGSSPTPPPQGGEADKAYKGTVIHMDDGGPPVYTCKIVIADLAGSEKISKSGVKGEGLAEATAINSSLTALGNVVHALHDGKLASYRDSNLTRLLKPSFSQMSAKVLLLAQIAPTQLTYDESMSTLHFANKVKAMKMVSEPGVETDKLPFEYLERAKTLQTLVGDLTIWAAQTGCSPSIRKLGVSHRTGYPFYAYLRDGKPKGKERIAAMLDGGAEEGYRKLRSEAVAAQEEDDRRFDASLVELQKHRKQQAIANYTDGLSAIEARRADIRAECSAVDSDNITLAQAAGRETIVGQEEEGFLSLQRAEVDAARVLVADVEAELKGLEKQVKKSTKAAAAANREPPEDRAAAEADDERFATAIYHHCGARRILNSALELRDTQFAFVTAGCNAARLSTWAARNGRLPPERMVQKPGGTEAGKQHVDPNAAS